MTRNVGSRIQMLRDERGLSQKALVDAVYVTQPSITDRKMLAYQPELKVLITLAAYFNVSVDYLLGISEIRTPADKMRECILSQDEMEFIRILRTIPEHIQQTLKTAASQMKSLVEESVAV